MFPKAYQDMGWAGVQFHPPHRCPGSGPLADPPASFLQNRNTVLGPLPFICSFTAHRFVRSDPLSSLGRCVTRSSDGRGPERCELSRQRGVGARGVLRVLLPERSGGYRFDFSAASSYIYKRWAKEISGLLARGRTSSSDAVRSETLTNFLLSWSPGWKALANQRLTFVSYFDQPANPRSCATRRPSVSIFFAVRRLTH
jgi:hypothetical protein